MVTSQGNSRADLSSKPYLETEAEVDEYLAKLKAELLAAIKAG